MRSVDIRLPENGVGHTYSRGVRPRPIPPRLACSLPSFSGDADAGWRRRIVGYEEGGRERLARGHAVFLEGGDALGREGGIVDQGGCGEAAVRLAGEAA